MGSRQLPGRSHSVRASETHARLPPDQRARGDGDEQRGEATEESSAHVTAEGSYCVMGGALVACGAAAELSRPYGALWTCTAAPHTVPWMQDEVRSIMADPPAVHGGAPGGVWATDEPCYEFLWENVKPGDSTAETGCGVSTAVIAARGARHTSVFLAYEEGAIFEGWAAQRKLDLSKVTLLSGGSEAVLPGLALGLLDLVLIDGNHGFPFPVLDWFYMCRFLKQDGLLVVDDCQIAGVQRLLEYLDHDPNWRLQSQRPKWRVYRRADSGTLVRGHWDQSFLPLVRASDVALVHRSRAVLHPLRQAARKVLGRHKEDP